MNLNNFNLARFTTFSTDFLIFPINENDQKKEYLLLTTIY